MPPRSFFATCRSEWQTPQYLISMATSFGPGSRRSKLYGLRGASAAVAAKARVAMGMWTDSWGAAQVWARRCLRNGQRSFSISAMAAAGFRTLAPEMK